ncbi:MAG TPA: cation diffusion facilitator family transporter, partial [Flavobacterium sp.]|nr:cation diffusion facilitator family transporter [Flavobacterium sp.]
MSTNPRIHKHNVKGNNLIFSILLNTIITIAQVIGGIVSGSLALISDALHNFSDVLSLIFSLVAHKLSRRKASVNQTFGFKRAELIAAFINAATLIIVAFILIYHAIIKLMHPEPIESDLVIWLALLGIAVNGF